MTRLQPGTQAIRRLGWSLALLLVGAAMLLTAWAMWELRDSEQRESRARAQLVADAMAARVTRAIALGIPVSGLVGVDSLFAERLRGLPDVAALALRSDDGRVLSMAAPNGGTDLSAGPSATSSVSHGGLRIGSVTLVGKQTNVGTLMLRWMLPLAAIVAAVAALAAQGLRRCWADGASAREVLVLTACRRIRGGDFGPRFAPLPRREFDKRLRWLTSELRHLNEQYLRVCRLVRSLGQTEPEAGRRDALEQVLRDTTGQDRFRADSTVIPLEVPGAQEARLRWQGTLAAAVAWLVAIVAQMALRDAAPGFPLAVLCATVAATGLLALAPRRGNAAYVRGFAMGFVTTGPGLAVPLLLLVRPEMYMGLGGGRDALLAWCALSCFAQALGLSRHVLAWFPRRAGMKA